MEPLVAASKAQIATLRKTSACNGMHHAFRADDITVLVVALPLIFTANRAIVHGSGAIVCYEMSWACSLCLAKMFLNE